MHEVRLWARAYGRNAIAIEREVSTHRETNLLGDTGRCPFGAFERGVRPMEVSVINLQHKIAVEPNFIREVVRDVLSLEGQRNSPDVSIALVDNAYIRVLNREYRGADQATDVLAFPMEPDRDGFAEPALGDVVISVERAREQARQFRHPLRRELALLAIHGVLHLLGYEDETEAGAAAMWSRQKMLLEKILGVRARDAR
ncbi:MAG TPA: rRNA maturation RNase YbeY [bacterium]|nr:rRNA maturation RNase YbeY [bacterium]